MVKAQTPTIAKIKNTASETGARALISLAICEVCDFFNVGKNMNDVQIAMTADMIIESYWYLKLEEIKYCFRRAMRTEKLFDRLDGNIILQWLEAYDAERTEEVIRLSEQKETQFLNQHKERPGDKTFDEYVASLKKRAAAGDEIAMKLLPEVTQAQQSGIGLFADSSIQHQHELAFKQYYYNTYLKRK